MNQPETEQSPRPVFALLTPTGRGAVATLVVSAGNLFERLNERFAAASGRSFSEMTEQAVVYGNWINTDGHTGEDLVICPLLSDGDCGFDADVQRVEIHCHGGTAAWRAITLSLESAGFHSATPQELERITGAGFWTSETDQALAGAATEKTAMILLEQRTLLTSAIAELRSLSIGEKDAEVISRIDTMLKWSRFGLHLSKPWSVVLCGAPNVGKSSLINAIVGFRRAIVHNTPGTTRDVVSQLTAVDGWPVEIKDTAGLRAAKEQIERSGIERAGSEIEKADCVIAVVDCTRLDKGRLSADDAELIERTNPDVIALNKIDAMTGSQKDFVPGKLTEKTGVVPVSALQASGLDDLVALIAEVIVSRQPPGGQTFPVTEAQVQRLEAVAEFVGKREFDAAIALLAK